MARFEILAGRHIEGTGDAAKEYRAGTADNIVESDKDLDKLFDNKFRRLEEPTRRPRDRDHTANLGGGKTLDAPLAARRAKASRNDPTEGQEEGQVRAAEKRNERVARGASPDVDYDENEDLEDDDETTKPAGTRTRDQEGGGEGEGDETPKARGGRKTAGRTARAAATQGTEEGGFGKDVTGEYDSTEEPRFKVFHDEEKKTFTVVKAKKPDTPVEEFTSKRQVERFFANQS